MVPHRASHKKTQRDSYGEDKLLDNLEKQALKSERLKFMAMEEKLLRIKLTELALM